MNSFYYPILKALGAEIKAINNMSPATRGRLVPLFELPGVPNRKKYRESLEPIKEFIEDACEEIGAVWAGKPAMFDAYQWSPEATTEYGESIVTAVYHCLVAEGLTVIPVIGYDRWESIEYQIALKSLISSHSGGVCIRLDQSAFDDSMEPEFFKNNLDDILESAGLEPQRCHLMLDMEDVTPLGVSDLLIKFDSLFSLVSQYGFISYSIAGCSLPKTINEAVKKPNTCATVLRKEMLLWQLVREKYFSYPIFFGDYGVRGPNTNEGVHSRHTNGKIRHTIDREYFVARGQSLSKPPKGEQMWGLAKKIVESPHYLGAEFSWGDSEIQRCYKKEFKGNSGQWIAIDTSHHLAFVIAEILEFERTAVFRRQSSPERLAFQP